MPRFRWVVLLSTAGLLIAILLTSYLFEVRHIEQLQSLLDERVNQLVALTRENQNLKKKIAYYETPEGIARLAREQFNLVKPNERIYRIKIAGSSDILPPR